MTRRHYALSLQAAPGKRKAVALEGRQVIVKGKSSRRPLSNPACVTGQWSPHHSSRGAT